MFITGFEVKDCLYITNKEIRSIKSTMKETMQLILGTNGSGKSVLCRLLTGWPPKPKSFKTGGHFQITGIRDKDEYLIRYDFSKSVKCTFIKNGDVLNDKSTTTVQKDLLKEHLGIDQDIYRLITGEAVFTKMSSGERKRWIDKVAPIDMGYLSKVYDRTRKAARDTKGAIKINTEQLHRQEARLDALGIAEDTEKEYKRLGERLQALTREYNENHPTDEDLIEKLRVLDLRFQVPMKALTLIHQRANKIQRDFNIKDLAGIDGRLLYLRKRDNELTAESESIMTDVAELDKALNTFKGYLGENVEELNESLADFKTKCNAIRERYGNSLPYNLSWEDHVLADTMYDFEDIVRKLAINMPNDSRPDWYTREAARKYLEERDELRFQLNNKSASLDRANDRLRQMESSRMVECENCNHSFHVGFSKQQLIDTKQSIVKMTAEYKAIEERLKSVQERVDEVHQYREANRMYTASKERTMRHSGFWATVEDKGYLGKLPSKLNDDFTRYNEVIGDIYSVHITEIEIKRIQTTLDNMARAGGTDANSIAAKRLEMLKHRDALISQIEAHAEETKLLNEFRQEVFNQSKLFKDLEAIADEIAALRDMLPMAIHNDIVRAEMESTMERFTAIRETVQRKENLNAMINSHRELLEEIKQNEADWKMLTAMLSPETGLIAHQVNSYLGGFMTMVNQSITPIWSYPIEVKPCNIDGGGLDYLFPVIMPTRRNNTDDVSECSKGQQEVINFAFVVAVYLCLDLTHLPLFLDELGSAFDEEHANKLMHYLNRMLDSQMVKQIFMVNHFQEMHGSLKNAEVLVLDEDNITPPVTANKHVEFNKL